jgi:hypothetical protein
MRAAAAGGALCPGRTGRRGHGRDGRYAPARLLRGATRGYRRPIAAGWRRRAAGPHGRRRTADRGHISWPCCCQRRAAAGACTHACTSEASTLTRGVLSAAPGRPRVGGGHAAGGQCRPGAVGRCAAVDSDGGGATAAFLCVCGGGDVWHPAATHCRARPISRRAPTVPTGHDALSAP